MKCPKCNGVNKLKKDLKGANFYSCVRGHLYRLQMVNHGERFMNEVQIVDGKEKKGISVPVPEEETFE